MKRAQYNRLCKSFKGAEYVRQWGGSDVWKIGGNVFAIASEQNNDDVHVTFKVSPIAFEILKEAAGCRPAPYLASRGLKWIQHYGADGPTDAELKDFLRESHKIVAAGLSKKAQRDLGLLD